MVINLPKDVKIPQSEFNLKRLKIKGEQKVKDKPKNRAEEVRQMLPMDKLGELLKEKSRKEICVEYNIKSHELANAIKYYERNNGFVAPAPIKPAKAKKKEGAVTTEPTPEPEKKCQCKSDSNLEREIIELRDEVEILKKEVAAVRAFSYRHRHQIGAGHYSELGVAD